MRVGELIIRKADVLVIGGGGAGLRAAIEARSRGSNVLIASKSRIGYASNTSISGSGMAICTGLTSSGDTPDVHFNDTLIAGEKINDRRLVHILVRNSQQQLQDLIEYGVEFQRRDGRLQPLQFPGHSQPRIYIVAQKLGQGMSIPMRNYADSIGVEFAEGIWISHLIKKNDSVCGATGIDKLGRPIIFSVKAVILATGGAGSIYWCNDNAGGITGDGYVLAYESGASLSDMEFVQFYPTASGSQGRNPIAYEHLIIRAGGILRNSLNEDIIDKYGYENLLHLTRDRLTQIIFQEIAAGRDVNGGIVIDLSEVPRKKIEEVMQQMPASTPKLRKHLIVKPTAHFFMGGIRINSHAETGVAGLYAIGEVCSGLHGANRLGGNALSEAYVFGAIAGKEAAAKTLTTIQPTIEAKDIKKYVDKLKSLTSTLAGESESEIREHAKNHLWQYAGIIRDQNGLQKGLEYFSSLKNLLPKVPVKEPRELCRVIELRNILIVAEMICRAALMRKESRGAHYRSDYPQKDDVNWLRNIYIKKHNADMDLETHKII